MSSPVEEEFQDPVLKEAVCKCWACDCAPSHLKQQVADLLERGNKSGWRMGRLSWMIWPAGLAALFIISVAFFDHIHLHASPALAALPVTLTTDLISRHDHCCGEANHHHIAAAKDDDVAIADALRSQLHRPMLVCRPADDSWLFKGASICPVGTIPSGHLVFAKGDQHLSLFSLPKTLTPGAVDGAEYSSTVDQHCVIGFVKDGALFCLVESSPGGSETVDELKQMELQMQPTVALMPMPQPARVELTELLQPVGH